nr:hypothetical protein [Arthrospira sp. SH-MAG29]
MILIPMRCDRSFRANLMPPFTRLYSIRINHLWRIDFVWTDENQK